MQKEDYMAVGTILKPHGLKGEMVIETDARFEDTLYEAECILVETEGELVPFFPNEEGVHFRTDTQCTLTFDELDSAEAVRPYCGCRIFLPVVEVAPTGDREELDQLIGTLVTDKTHGQLGRVIQVDDFSGNIVLTIDYKNREVLVPLTEELIEQYDPDKRTLDLDLPSGLIELYLE
ncbi:MAG: ribosome maturation factor RimM [Marinilabiliales bacterium]|nr:ribosome maturation factor RimM [Marinilabiliales bacterium]